MEALRIILIVLGSVIGFIILLAVAVIFCRIHVEFFFGQKKYIRFRLFCFWYTLRFDKKKKEKKPKKKKTKDSEKKEKKPSKLEQRASELSVGEIIEVVRAFIDKYVKKLFFSRVELNICVASPEADKTALLYGEINAAVYPILGFMDAAGRLGKAKVNIIPDFSRDKTTVECKIVIITRVWHLISGILYLIKQKII